MNKGIPTRFKPIEVECKMCGRTFQAKNITRKFCGAQDEPGSCNYKQSRMKAREKARSKKNDR